MSSNQIFYCVVLIGRIGLCLCFNAARSLNENFKTVIYYCHLPVISTNKFFGPETLLIGPENQIGYVDIHNIQNST